MGCTDQGPYRTGEDPDLVTTRVIDGLLDDREASLDAVRAIAERWGVIEHDSARNPSETGGHYLRVMFVLSGMIP